MLRTGPEPGWQEAIEGRRKRTGSSQGSHWPPSWTTLLGAMGSLEKEKSDPFLILVESLESPDTYHHSPYNSHLFYVLE